MITYKQRHSKKNFSNNSIRQKILTNIDYLIVNLDGQSFGSFPETSLFHFKDYEYGTKIFSRRSDLYYNGEKIGQFMSNPRSEIISKDLAQLQFENHLFYTKSLQQLKQLLNDFCEETQYYFKSINRLDVCLDKSDYTNDYRNLHDNILNGNYLISGRPKNIQSYFETYKGKSVLNGFQVGKRTSDKIVRVYNKSLSLQLTEKPYINEFYQNNNLKNDNVWRFEYQLNSSFFRGLNIHSSQNSQIVDSLTWGIFDVSVLFELLKIANKGFFEIRLNTGKSQINKEIEIKLFDFEYLKTLLSVRKPIVRRLKKVILSNTLIKKRLAKSLFREYYSNNQDISYIVALNLLLENIDFTTQKKLLNWFKLKINYYLHEFKFKEKIIKNFDLVLFNEHQLLFL